MRGLMAAVIGMGILIVVGVTVIVMTLVHRMSSAAAPNASVASTGPVAAPVPGEAALARAITLDEPAGTRIAGSSPVGATRLAIRLEGGGPDRIVVVDTQTGQVAARVSLAR